MKAILIFDNVNDLLYHKWDDIFLERIKSFGDNSNTSSKVHLADSHNVSQVLSPIITSQRVMGAQFGNTYSSMECLDGTNIVFDEWLDHVLIIVGENEIDDMQRELLDCKSFLQHLCGQNIKLLQSPIYQQWLSVLLDNRTNGDYVPGASGIISESGATSAALNALKSASKDINSAISHYHLMLYIGDKLLALFSSRGSDDLTPPDIIMISIQCMAIQEHWSEHEKKDKSKDDLSENSHIPWLSEENSAIVHLCSGSSGTPSVPYSMHVAAIAPRVLFVILQDMELRDISIPTHHSIQVLCNLKRILLQRNMELLPQTLDSLEGYVKKIVEALRKNKSNSNLCARLSTRMAELRKSCSNPSALTPETTSTSMWTAIDTVIEQLRPDIPSLNMEPPLQELRVQLAPYIDFLRVKALRYFSLQSADVGSETSDSLSLHKYIEEFPGLVHFIYIDRGTGRFMAPDLVDCGDLLTRDTVRKVLSLCSKLVHSGYTAASWRLRRVHATYILWWERGDNKVASKPLHPPAVQALSTPGDVLGAFYRQLLDQGFPNATSNVSIKEIICIHLGLIPAATAVEQARRLACTIKDVVAMNESADLL